MSTWTINGSSPESLGLVIAGGQFNSGTASRVELKATRDFDSGELFTFNSTVTIARDGSPFFSGKVRAIPKNGYPDSEGHDYLIEDAWAELERLTYQEPWLIRQSDYAGVIWSPKAVLGMNSSGVRINVGQQIAEVLTFAIGRSVALQAATMPTGMMLWPTEITGMSCAQVIRYCLQYYPDWLPWIDHSVTPPRFRVTPRSSATAINLGVTECSTLDVTRTQDRVPSGVKIIYETVNQVDGEVYRTSAIDQAPRPSGLSDAEWKAILVGPAGDGILVTPVELAGLRVQIQKQQVTVREMPTDAASAKDYLKEKFPIIKDIANSKLNVTEWTRAVIPAPGDPAPEIDTKLERLYGAGLTGANGLKNELLDGALPEWIQKRVGKVLVKFTVEKASGATLTEDEEKALSQLPPWFHVVATNAETKIYQGVSSYEPAEAVPVGIAAAFYATMVQGCNYAGTVTQQSDELPSDLGHGRVINLTGSAVSAWSTMQAPIHTVTWDLASCKVTRSFGPNPDLSVEDFIEFLKLLNKRPYSTYTLDERTSDKLGNGSGVSARGDTVGPTWTPETITGGGSGGGGSGGGLAGAFCRQYVIGEGLTGEGDTYLQAGTITGSNGGSAVIAYYKTLDVTTGVGSLEGDKLYLSCNVTAALANGIVQPGVTLNSATLTTTLPTAHTFSTTALTGVIFREIGRWTDTEFLPSGACGISTVSGCPGSFAIQ